jgi:hypothetical protein
MSGFKKLADVHRTVDRKNPVVAERARLRFNVV